MEEEIEPTPALIPTEEGPQRRKGPAFSTTFASFRYRNYQLYFGGQLVSNVGTWMQIIAQGWLVYELTHSELVLGIVGFASAIPALLVTPWGGVVVDWVNKRSLLIITQLAAMILAFILAVLTFTDKVTVWQIVILAAFTGLVNAFDAPARMAFIVDMVNRPDLPNAIALNSLMFNLARVLGPAIGGILLAAVGAAWCFTINGISFLAVVVCLMAMHIVYQRKPPSSDNPVQQLAAGVRYVRSQNTILALVLLTLVFSIFGVSYVTLLPAYVDKVLRAGPTWYGVVNAFTGLGAVTAALILAQPTIQGRRGRILNLANMGFPLVLGAFAYVRIPILSLPLAFGLGVGFMMQFALINTLLQTVVEDELRGRVMALYTLTFFGFAPFGNLIIGVAAEAYGLSVTILVSAVITLILGRLIFWRVREIKKLP